MEANVSSGVGGVCMRSAAGGDVRGWIGFGDVSGEDGSVLKLAGLDCDCDWGWGWGRIRSAGGLGAIDIVGVWC